MTKEVQLRRGTTAQVFAFTGQVGELTPDTTLKRLVLHDGLTAGGKAIDAPRGHIDGLVLANNGTAPDTDLDIAPGQARDSANATIMEITATLTKRLSAAWAAGSGNGGLFSGAVAASTWYHVHLIEKDADGSIDAGFDTDVAAANRPAGYSRTRRIGSVKTDGSSNILAFAQFLDLFLWSDPPLDVVDSALGGTAKTYALGGVPPGLRVLARLNMGIGGVGAYVSPLVALDEAPSTTAAPLFTIDNSVAAYQPNFEILTDTSAQIRARSGGGTGTLRVATLGWIDPRGRNA